MFYVGYMDESKRKNAKGYKYIGKGFKTIEEAKQRKEELKAEKPYLNYFVSDGKIN